MSIALAFASAALLGFSHALEPDHMAAVTAFAVRKPAPRAAAVFGMRWALGHGAILMIAGVLLFAIGLALPAAAVPWLDRFAGGALILLGVSTAFYTARVHEHVHAPTAVGALHGLAGAAPAIALLQLAGPETVTHSVFYLLCFAMGTALGMAVYAVVAGYLLRRASERSLRTARMIGRLTGICTVAVGFVWLIR
jgi:nickel/cobalt transporter (NicO) family protein